MSGCAAAGIRAASCRRLEHVLTWGLDGPRVRTASVANVSMSDIDWGDAPTWIAALFAGGAAWFAGKTLQSQRKQLTEQRAFIGEQSANLTLERAELRAAAEERRTGQARRINMELMTAASAPDGTGVFRGYDHWRVQVRNASDEPIRDVLIRFGDAYDPAEAAIAESSHLPDGGRRGIPVALVGPGLTVGFRSPKWQEITVDNNRPVAFFTDSNGVRWRLDEHGELAEQPRGEATPAH